jgi:altronate dehydratase large subunit
VTGNAHTYQRMREDMDLDASSIISGAETVAQVGQRMFDLALRVIAGEATAAEEMQQHQFMMLRQGPVY